MTRTFSKIYGLGGLRLGWCYAPAHVCDVLNRVRGPFNVTSPAIAAGAAAVRDVEYTQAMVQKNAQQHVYVSEQLTQLGFEVVPSVANFVLCAPRNYGKSAEEVVQALAEREIFVRGVAAYGLAEYVRISIGTEEENAALLAVLRESRSSPSI
jgi:histidinol-phosphate aminotransferase